MCIKFWLGNLKGRDYLEKPQVNKMIISEWMLKELGGKLWPEFM
jgi:hypothetical protein